MCKAKNHQTHTGCKLLNICLGYNKQTKELPNQSPASLKENTEKRQRPYSNFSCSVTYLFM